jgi:hypothetical protein
MRVDKKEPAGDDKVTREEFRSIMKAMDKDGFETLMSEYVKEISDPNNTKETNEYLKQAEANKDLPKNVKLAQPIRGMCIKSEKFSIKRPGVRQKVFINICSYDGVNPPEENKQGMWSLPHLLNKGRNDQDKKGVLCTTFDVVFHSLALKLAKENPSFKKYVIDTSINGINNNLLKSKGEKVSSDYILKKYDFKGNEVPLINVHSLNSNELDSRNEPNENYKTKIMKEIDEMKNVQDDEDDRIFDKIDVDQSNRIKEEVSYPISPKYKIKFSDDFEFHKFFYDPHLTLDDQYKKLVVEFSVPLLESLNNAELNLDVNRVVLKYKDIYYIELSLPVSVDKDASVAKFDRKKNLLSVTAQIVRKNKEVLKLKEDENIEIVQDEETPNEKTTEEPPKIKNKMDTNIQLKNEKTEENIIPNNFDEVKNINDSSLNDKNELNKNLIDSNKLNSIDKGEENKILELHEENFKENTRRSFIAAYNNIADHIEGRTNDRLREQFFQRTNPLIHRPSSGITTVNDNIDLSDDNTDTQSTVKKMIKRFSVVP